MKRMIYPQFPQGKKKCFTMSYDDGHDADIRMVEKMRSCGVRGTFNLNSGQMPAEPQTYEKWGHMTMEQCVALYGDDMEIAVHGASHPHWQTLGAAEMVTDIVEDRRALERGTGRIIRGAAYPYCTYDDQVVRALEMADIQYCRTTKVTGVLAFHPQQDWLRWAHTCHHKDQRLMNLAHRLVEWDNKRSVLYVMAVWGHSYEFIKDDNWHILDELLDVVAGHEEIWYTTNIELVEYLKAWDRLVYNLDKTQVHNPTDKDIWIWLEWADETVIVPAGKTVELP